MVRWRPRATGTWCITIDQRQQGSASLRLRYRAEIDGLRAVAVSLVVLFHAGFGGTPGGYVGVDVFYVISGYLITSLLMRELDARGTIRLLDFWGRRMRRILPAGVLVLCVSLIGATALLPPLRASDAAHDLPAAALYVINWRLADKAVDYFAAETEPSVYLQYWSLAIEEQFYAVWPLLVLGVALLAFRFSRKPAPAQRVVLWTAIVISLISFAVCLALTRENQPYAFFGTFSRAWQLGLGAIIGLAPHVTMGSRLRRTLALLGLSAILAAGLLFTRETPYPGFAALLPTVGTAAIIFAVREQDLGGAIGAGLRSSPLVHVGKWSYSWYLWHWPVLVLGTAVLGAPTPIALGLLVLASLLLACLTYYTVEQPARFWPYLTSSPGRSVAAGLALSLGAAGLALLAQATFAKPTIILSTGTRLNAEAVRDDKTKDCLLSHAETSTDEDCTFGDPSNSKQAVLFGDSHAAALLPAIKRAAETAGWTLLVRTKASCPSIDVATWSVQLNRAYEECSAWRAAVLAELARLDPEVIVLANMPSVPGLDKTQSGASPHETLLKGETSLVDGLLKTTRARIVLVKDVPQSPRDPVTCLAGSPGNEAACAWPRRKAAAYPRATYDGNKRVTVLDLNDAVCPQGTCGAVQNGLVVMRDSHHLTASFAATLAPRFEALLRAQSP